MEIKKKAGLLAVLASVFSGGAGAQGVGGDQSSNARGVGGNNRYCAAPRAEPARNTHEHYCLFR